MSPRKESGDASPHSKSALGWADFCPPRQALSRSPFSAVWKLRRFLQAGGRSFLMSIRAPLGRWIDRSVGRSTFTRDANRELHFPEQKIPKKIQKTVLHLFSGLDTSAQT